MICPKCGMEFKDGMETCTDCGTKLVQDLSGVSEEKIALLSLPFAYAERLKDYLKYSHIDAELQSNEEIEGEGILYVNVSDKEQASKHVAIFLSQEPVTEEVDDTVEDPDDMDSLTYSADAEGYKSAKARYEEARSTAFTFTGASILILLVVLDRFTTHLLPQGSILTYIVFLGIAIGLIFGAVKYFSSLKNLAEEACAEGSREGTVRSFMSTHFFRSTLDDLVAEQFGWCQMEEHVLNREYYLNGILKDQFPDMDRKFLEYEVDQFLSEMYDQPLEETGDSKESEE